MFVVMLIEADLSPVNTATMVFALAFGGAFFLFATAELIPRKWADARYRLERLGNVSFGLALLYLLVALSFKYLE